MRLSQSLAALYSRIFELLFQQTEKPLPFPTGAGDPLPTQASIHRGFVERLSKMSWQGSIPLSALTRLMTDVEMQHTWTKGTLCTGPSGHREGWLTREHRLVGTGQMDKAAIFDAQGSSVWATSPGFSVRGNQFCLAATEMLSRAPLHESLTLHLLDVNESTGGTTRVERCCYGVQ